MNPYLIELMVKARQEELLDLARPRRVALPTSEGRSLGYRIRIGLARLMIRMGWRLASDVNDRGCPHCHEGEAGSVVEPLLPCDCPGRGQWPDCPPLARG
jgi:hypothetical protein